MSHPYEDRIKLLEDLQTYNQAESTRLLEENRALKAAMHRYCRCIFCDYAGEDLQALKQHSSNCEKHPLYDLLKWTAQERDDRQAEADSLAKRVEELAERGRLDREQALHRRMELERDLTLAGEERNRAVTALEAERRIHAAIEVNAKRHLLALESICAEPCHCDYDSCGCGHRMQVIAEDALNPATDATLAPGGGDTKLAEPRDLDWHLEPDEEDL